MKAIKMLVTDLDDTIWDWLGMWHASFKPYFNRIAEEFSVDREELKASFKRLHQQYGSSESSHFYHELDCLTEEQKSRFEDSAGDKRSIIHEYNSNKKNSLQLYDGVLETLRLAAASGTLVVGFTESSAFYTKYRIKHLGLDGLIDFVYAPIDEGLPASAKRYYEEGYWEPKITQFRYLSKETKKPNPEILNIIIRDFGLKTDEVIYVGDKLDRDIAMANDVNVDSIYAKYGSETDNDAYNLLREVTHWSDEEVEREKKAKEEKKTSTNEPTIVLKKSYKEIQDQYKFEQYVGHDRSTRFAEAREIWEKAIEVQMHFNDLELRIRNFALTLFTFTIVATGWLANEHYSISVLGFEMSAGVLMPIVGVFVMGVFWFMDRHWYHNLLIGAVLSSSRIEDIWSKHYPELNLTKSISERSPSFKLHSKQKISVFYAVLAFSLLLITWCIANYGSSKQTNTSVEKLEIIVPSSIRIEQTHNHSDVQTSSPSIESRTNPKKAR